MSETQNDPTENIITPESQTQESNEGNDFGLEREVIDACLAVIQEYRSGEISKPQATLQLQELFPRTMEEPIFLEAYGSYLGMLDNFDRFRDNALQRGTAAGNAEVSAPGAPEQPRVRDSAQVDRPAKRPRAVQSDDESGEDDDEYRRRTRLDYDALPWNQERVGGKARTLSPSLQKTQSILANFAKDLKRAKASLLNCGKPYPQFPDSEWGNLLGGKSIDLDHVLSGMYSLSHVDREAQPIGKGLEIVRGSSKPARTVQTHGEWIMAFNAYVAAALFIFPHREQELRDYGDHIMRFFASMPTEFHERVINYDKAVRVRTAQRRDLELTDYGQYSDLHLQWINNPAVSSSARSTSSRPQRKPGQRREACRRWNEQRCPNSASSCNYAHVCSKCRNNAHVGGECQPTQRK